MGKPRDRLESIDEDAPVFKFVLTGGPCGGKTTAMARLSTFLRERGFRVYTVPEAATLLFSNGASFVDLTTDEQQLQFQVNIMRTQVHLENTFAGLASLSGKPCVLLCDRGLMDGSAYIADDVWRDLLEREDMDVITARDQRYNAVLHLVTAAQGAESFYTLDNNETRLESPEEARRLDDRVLRAWVGHPRLTVLDNSTDFETKLQRAVAAVEKMVGLPTTERRTRRYRLKRCPARDEISVECEEFDVEKVYLRLGEKAGGRHPGDHTFVRRRGQQATASYAQTACRYVPDPTANGGSTGSSDSANANANAYADAKNDDDAAEAEENQDEDIATTGAPLLSPTAAGGNAGEVRVRKIERKRIITAREYSNAVRYLADPTRHIVRQRRISFLWEGQYYEITQYLAPEEAAGLTMLNVQVHAPPKGADGSFTEEVMTFPPWIEVDEDTTGKADSSGVFISLKDKAAIDTIAGVE